MKTAQKYLVTLMVVVVFAKMFVLEGSVPWVSKFALFSVPVQVFPYGDLRNVQSASYCRGQGLDMRAVYERNDCMKSGLPATSIYPGIDVPALNYPPAWVRMYNHFDAGTERHFLKWGKANSWLLLAALLMLCWPRQHLLLPLLLFSPPVLLCVERGNTDGATFAVLFMGLFMARGPLSRAAVIMLAAGMKLFPLFGAVVYLSRGRRGWVFLAGLALGSVVLIEPAMLLGKMVGATTGGFETAYGLWNYRHAPFLLKHGAVSVYLTQALLLCGMAALAWRGMRRPHAHEIGLFRDMKREDLDVCLVSLVIFLATYLLFFNWAYRAIFVLPAMVILSRIPSRQARGFCLTVAILFWMPWLAFGWKYFNVGATVVALWGAWLLPHLRQVRRGLITEAA